MARHNRLGEFGEGLAADFLTRRGYKIISRNERLSHKELDIIAKNGPDLIFVEVKTKNLGQAAAEDYLTHAKIKKVKQAMVEYCLKHRFCLARARADFIAISLNLSQKKAKIKHFKNIF